jgi:transposase InsO family protein
MADEKWCGDPSEIPTEEGKLYVASALDLAARHIPGFAFDEHHDAELAGALKEVARYVDRDNTTRRHRSCEMHSPVNYEQILAARAAEEGKAAGPSPGWPHRLSNAPTGTPWRPDVMLKHQSVSLHAFGGKPNDE